MTRDDELARTATAAGLPPDAGTSAPALGATLGRYRLERELGAGGMGVVHAAFDPDLERRVALKVLRSAASGDEARQRLLREARAMARLSHPNVVVVHEVGSAGGRDYVAMELIDGTTLDEWQRAERRGVAAVYEAYVAAGRGLAAAHAAGLVHRDFKPHNVLRGRDGRVVVTDFGLARGLDARTDPEAPTKDLGPVSEGASTPSSLSGLTRTGSVLGTPAYMSPEQWRGETGPASDQFAFCIALWEALAGRRPFRGDTAEALRAEVERGPSPRELRQLPRRVRGALRRGLDPDPTKRWPTMDTLLDKLVADEKRSRFLWLLAGGAATSAALYVVIAALTYRPDPPRPPAGAPLAAGFVCPPPMLDPSAVWSPRAEAAMAASGQRPAASQLASDFTAWTAARAAACKLGTGSGGDERRACLDAVLARFDAVAQGITKLGSGGSGDDPADAGALLVDPAVCAAAPVPRLVAPSPLMREVLARSVRADASTLPQDPAALAALLEKATPDPCASAVAARLAAGAQESLVARGPLLERAATDAERCGDDRVRADIAIARVHAAAISPLIDVAQASKLAVAEAAIARVAQPDLAARLDRVRAADALRNDDMDDAIARYDASAAEFAARGRTAEELTSLLQAETYRLVRARPDEIAASPQRLAALRARAVAELGERDSTVREIDRALAEEQFYSGDVAGAHARFAALRVQEPQRHARRITGHVVDEHGAPVAGAKVTAGSLLRGDAIGAAMAWPVGGTQRFATTDATGAFAIDDAIRDGGVVAEAGALRSWGVPIADDVKLVVRPTTHVTGRVELHGTAARDVTLAATDTSLAVFRDYAIIAPVARDGAFDFVAPHGEIELTAVANTAQGLATTNTHAQLDKPEVPGLALALPTSSRSVDVILRSTVSGGPGNAEIVLVAGKLPATLSATGLVHRRVLTMRFGRPIEAGHAPPAVVAKAGPGDLFATLHGVGDGDLTACAIALPTEIADATAQKKIDANYDKLTFRCVPVTPKDELLTIEVPPWPRLD